MATYDFDQVLVWDVNPGGAVRTLRNATVTVVDPETSATVTTVTSDSNGRVTFTTTDVPTVILRMGSGFERRVTSQDAIEAAAGYTVSEDAAVASLVNDAGSATRAATAAAIAANPTVTGKVSKGADVVNVKDYGATGNGGTDDTDAFNSAITANPGRTIVVPKGTYLIDPAKGPGQDTRYPVGIRLNQPGTQLVLDPGATLQSKTTSVQRYAIVEMSAVDTAISGGKIVGDLTTHVGTTGEWGYCILITPTADRARVEDMALADPWGDCVIVGSGPEAFSSGVLVKDVTLLNVRMDRARRNNLSVISGRDLKVIGCSFTRAGTLSGTVPKDGVDVEPNPSGLEDVINATFIGCTFADNAGQGFCVHAQNRTASVSVQGCVSRGNLQHGYVLTSTASVDFANCLATGNTLAGFTPDSYTGKATSFVNCRAVGNGSLGFSLSTGMQAIGCTAEDNTVGGFLAAGTARLTGCTSKGNNPTSGSQYYGNFSVESGTGVVFTGCHSDAGINAIKPSYGWRLFGGVTGTVVTGCSSSGTFPAAAYQDSATGTVANPVPGKAVGFAGATTTTTAPAAGGAGALPATPLGYYTVNINGTDRKVAFY